MTREEAYIGGQKLQTYTGAWSFRVWSAYMRNQILRNATISKWQALVTPQEPGSADKTALILYNSGATPLSTTDINFAFAEENPTQLPISCGLSPVR